MMKAYNKIFVLLFIIIGSTFSNILLAQQNGAWQYISSTSPQPNGIGVSPVTNITVSFDSIMADATLNDRTFFTFGSQSGIHEGIISYDTITRTVTFDPTYNFFSGEVVTAILTKKVRTLSGTNLASSFVWSFTIGLSSGSGSFQRDADYNTFKGAQSIYGGDLDRDGDIDLACAINSKSNNMKIFQNNGEGIFIEKQTLTVGDTPRSINGGDFDKDGDIDLVTANDASKEISILFNLGNGTFKLNSDYKFNENPFFVVVNDFNGDGNLDVATANRKTNSVSILLNNGDGTFVIDRSYEVGKSPHSLTSGDFNRDGSIDLAITELESNQLSILINSGDATFDLANVYRTGSSNSKPHFIRAADINGDYNLDLMVTNREVDNVIVLQNRGDGSYFLDSSYEVGNEPRALYLGDLDHDIDLDMVTANFRSNDIFVHLNNGAGKFLIDSTYITGNSPCFVFGGDLDKDGDIDLVTANFNGQTISILKNVNSLPTNYPPESPLLIIPQHGSFISESMPNLTWQVPDDRNGDSLHFRVELNNDNTRTFDSFIDPTGFNPPPPVKQGVGTATYLLQENLPDGRYEWRITARDQYTYGKSSSKQQFTVDTTPPVIDSLVALAPGFPPNWYNQDSIEVVKIRIFYDEAHALGATLATGGLGDPDELSIIPSGMEQIVEFDINVVNDPDGNYQLQATLRDSAGNQMVSSPLIIKLDATPPAIAHVPQYLVFEDQPIIINSVVKDNNRIHQVRLYYRKGGENSYHSLPMDAQDDTTFQAAIPEYEVGSRGIDYFLMATDGLSDSHSPSLNWEAFPHHIQVRVIRNNNNGLVNDSPQPGGSEQKAFRMISVPIIIDDPQPGAVLEDDLGPYNRQKWRFFHYNTQSGTYNEFPDTDSFSPGKAFWLIVKDADKIIDSGIGTSVPSDSPFVVPLQRGWNDIANPFNFAIDWNNITVSSGNIQDIMGPYTYEDRWLIPSETVKILPWQGYSVYTEYNDLSLIIPPIESSPGLNKSLGNPFSDVQWHLILEATCQLAQDAANIIGCSEGASVEWDKRDYLEPPPIGSYVSLLFPHDKWDRFPGCYTTDFRPDFNIGETWDFRIKTNIENSEVKLRILNIRTIPSMFEVMFYDISGYQKINISDTSIYSFQSHRNESVRSFKLVIGIPEFVSEVEGEIPLAPGNFYLTQNYPNPFNLGTQIQYQLPQTSMVNLKIFNVLGQEIRTLISEEQETGYYKIQWNGKDDYNRDVGTGIYILRIKAGDFVQTRKMILTK